MLIYIQLQKRQDFTGDIVGKNTFGINSGTIDTIEVYIEMGGNESLESCFGHGNLGIFIMHFNKGGFSDNFVLLDKKIQTEVLKRTEHHV